MPSSTPTHALEQSTYKVTVSFFDETAAAVTPSAATWTLMDGSGNVINSRLAVAISSLSTTATILLSGADLAITTLHPSIARVLLVEYTYSSSLGSDLPGKDQLMFTIDDLVGVS